MNLFSEIANFEFFKNHHERFLGLIDSEVSAKQITTWTDGQTDRPKIWVRFSFLSFGFPRICTDLTEEGRPGGSQNTFCRFDIFYFPLLFRTIIRQFDDLEVPTANIVGIAHDES